MADHSTITPQADACEVRDGDVVLGTISRCPRQQRRHPSHTFVARNRCGEYVGGGPTPPAARAVLLQPYTGGAPEPTSTADAP